MHPRTPVPEMEELSQLLQIPISVGTVNRGSDVIGAGVVANDWAAFVGMDATSTEIGTIEKIFKLSNNQQGLHNAMMDTA